MQSHHNQEQMDVRTEDEILVRGHVRRRKPNGSGKMRTEAKPYPTKWGHGKAYGFDDARVFVTFRGERWYVRLAKALRLLIGSDARVEGRVVVFAPKGVKPHAPLPISRIASINNPREDDEYLVGPLQ